MVGWVVTVKGQIQAEGWLDLETSLEDQLANTTFSANSELNVNTNQLENISQLHQLANQYQIQDVQIAKDIHEKLQLEEAFLNRRHYTFHREKRPYIVLKWAQTVDGFVARSNYDSKWISGIHARKLVHQWRSQKMANCEEKNN